MTSVFYFSSTRQDQSRSTCCYCLFIMSHGHGMVSGGPGYGWYRVSAHLRLHFPHLLFRATTQPTAIKKIALPKPRGPGLENHSLTLVKVRLSQCYSGMWTGKKRKRKKQCVPGREDTGRGVLRRGTPSLSSEQKSELPGAGHGGSPFYSKHPLPLAVCLICTP